MEVYSLIFLLILEVLYRISKAKFYSMTNKPMTVCLFLGMLIPAGSLLADPIVFHNVKVQVEAQEEEKPKLLPNPVELLNKPATAPVMNATATQISIPSLRPEERATVSLGSPKIVSNKVGSSTDENEVPLKKGPVRPVPEQAKEVKAVVNDSSDVSIDDSNQPDKKPKVVVLPPKASEESAKSKDNASQTLESSPSESPSEDVAKANFKEGKGEPSTVKVVDKSEAKDSKIAKDSKKADKVVKKTDSKKEIVKAPVSAKPTQPILVTSKADVDETVPSGATPPQYESQGAALSSGFTPPPPSPSQVDPSPSTGYSESEVSSLLDAARGQRDPTMTPTFDPPVVGKVW
jgi:hypothetical protein